MFSKRRDRKLRDAPLRRRWGELAPRRKDAAWLDSFAPGAVGAAYRNFVRGENISAEGLADISRERYTPATVYDAIPVADRDGAIPKG